MPTSVSSVFQRFEFKYIINEVLYSAIKHHIQPFTTPDAHTDSSGSYAVNSLYLDSPNLEMHQSSEMGEKNRVKLRIRSYAEEEDSPAYFEIKRRLDQIVKKQRASVSKDLVPTLLNGTELQPDMLTRPGRGALNNLRNFRDLMETMNASPRVMVRYEREAYMSRLGDPVRVTFDRRLMCLPCVYYSPDVWVFDSSWIEVNDFSIVMEVKFTDVFPLWIQETIERFNLLRDSLAKYCVCINQLKQLGHSVEGENRRAGWML